MSAVALAEPIIQDEEIQLLEREQPESEKKEVASSFHEVICAELIRYLGNYVRPLKLGYIHTPNAKYILREGQPRRQPDVSFVSVAKMPVPLRQADLPFAPDIAVEVASTNDSLYEIEEKIIEYQEAGVGLVWIVRPVLKLVEVHRLGQTKPTLLGIDDELDGESVLPGFKLAVKALFE